MSPSQLRPVLLIFALHLCSTCTALPLDIKQTPPRDEAVNVPPGRSVLVSTRVSGYDNNTNSFQYYVFYDGELNNSIAKHVYMDQSLSYYEAENTGYVITAWRQSDSQYAEVAARVFNLPDLDHHNITVVFILNRERIEINRTRFDINLLELSPTSTTTLESSTVDETTHITTSWSPSSSLPTVSSIAVVSSSATGTPGSVADAGILPPGATAAVSVSAAVAVGSVVVCTVTVVACAVVLTRSRRHKKPANPEDPDPSRSETTIPTVEWRLRAIHC